MGEARVGQGGRGGANKEEKKEAKKAQKARNAERGDEWRRSQEQRDEQQAARKQAKQDQKGQAAIVAQKRKEASGGPQFQTPSERTSKPCRFSKRDQENAEKTERTKGARPTRIRSPEGHAAQAEPAERHFHGPNWDPPKPGEPAAVAKKAKEAAQRIVSRSGGNGDAGRRTRRLSAKTVYRTTLTQQSRQAS